MNFETLTIEDVKSLYEKKIISFLELFVAFLQAFIFMFLTTVFIGQMSSHDEEHDSHGLEAAAH